MESSEHLISVTFSTPFTLSWMEVRITSLVSLNAINNTAQVIVVNIREYGDKLESRSLNDCWDKLLPEGINPLKPKLNPICYLLALLGAHHFLHISRIRVKSLTLRLLMS